MRVFLLPALAVVLGAGADNAASDAVKKELKKLEGTWVVESVVADGKEIEAAKGSEAVFAGARFTMKKGDGKEDRATIKVGPSKTPKTIDFVIEEPKSNGPGRGIYEIQGPTLRLCLSPPNQPRPTAFSDKDQVLITLKRKK